MKIKLLAIIITLICITQLFSMTEIENILNSKNRFSIINDIPAVRGYDKATYFVFPLITSNLNFTNTILNYDDFSIFYEDHFITNQEKKMLTKNDLKIFLTYQTPIIKFNIKNFGMDLSLYSGLSGKVLNKQLTKLILYGNDKNSYTLHNGKNLILYTFSKLKYYYTYGKPLKLDFMPSVNSKYPLLNNSIDFIKNIPLYVGVNLNYYKPIYYGEVLNSEQSFGTNITESYANYKVDVIYTDIINSKYKRKTTMGLGISLAGDLQKGYFYFDLDDIFAGIKFDKLTEKIYQGTFQDSLSHFDNTYETVNNDTIIEKTKNRYKSISCSFTMGTEYNVYKGIYAMLEYKSSKYKYPNGWTIGARKTLFGFFPIGFKIGYDNITNYQILTGLYFTNLEFYFKYISYGGFFNYANGSGIDLTWVHRF